MISKAFHSLVSMSARAASLLTLTMLVLSLLAPRLALAEDDEDEEVVESSYVAIEPAIVTNYGGPGRLRYMSVEVSLRVSGVPGEESVGRHMPNIKDTLLSLFAIQTNDSIGTAAGKEALRVESLKQVSEILAEEDNPDLLEDLLFTGFVVYR